MPTNRELATGILVSALILLVTWRDHSFVGQIATIGRLLLGPKIAVPFALYALYVAALVTAGARLGWWSTILASDTAIWFVTAGSPLLMNIDAAAKPGFFGKTALATVGIGAVLVFYLNLVSMSLMGELALQTVLFFCGAIAVVAGRDRATLPARRLAQVTLLVIALWLAWITYIGLSANWAAADKVALAQSFALPVWLTIGCLPFVWLFSLVANYRAAATRAASGGEQGRSSWRLALALVLGFRLSNRDLRAYNGWRACDLARITSVREGVGIVEDFRAKLRAEEAARRTDTQNLHKYAGVLGTDAEGRQLDRREFKETKRALQWLSTCQMGWYNSRHEGYRPEMLEIQNNDFTRHGLPAEHGITLVVSRRHRAWYAWRRAPSGYVFGIGAAKAPPDCWCYAGPEPPGSFPTENAVGWRSSLDEPSVEWD